jgi:pyruvate dehydrogenase E2 component (dihydrolipoamide acetyltransferase)
MGYDMERGTVVRWLKREGDSVTRGEPLAEIETDKAVVEIEAYDSGVLRKVYIKEGTTVPVGQVIGIIGAPGEKVPDAPAPAPAAPAAAGPVPASAGAPAKAGAERAAPAPPPRGPGDRTKASPLARREAEARKIDLAEVAGTGPGGRITREDVIAFAEGVAKAVPAPLAAAAQALAAAPGHAPPTAPPVALGQLVPLTRMRQAIARSMSRSKQEVPHFYVTVAVAMSQAVQVRQQLNEALEGGVRISINDMVIKACAEAILKHPMFNASFTEGGVQVHKQVNIGMAIALDAGLVAPAILDCDRKGLAEIARETKSLAERARAGRMTAQEYSSATFTVTNLGMFGVESFSAIITPPQAAALAVGSVLKEAVVKDGQVAVADVMRLTLSIDHRVADGAQAAAFLAEVRTLLESPVRLLL